MKRHKEIIIAICICIFCMSCFWIMINLIDKPKSTEDRITNNSNIGPELQKAQNLIYNDLKKER